MKYVYLVTNNYDYEGYSVVTVETSAKKAINVAEKNLGGDFTNVMQYQIGQGDQESKMIAEWQQITSYNSKRNFKRVK